MNTEIVFTFAKRFKNGKKIGNNFEIKQKNEWRREKKNEQLFREKLIVRNIRISVPLVSLCSTCQREKV